MSPGVLSMIALRSWVACERVAGEAVRLTRRHVARQATGLSSSCRPAHEEKAAHAPTDSRRR